MVHEYDANFLEGQRALSGGDAREAYKHWLRCLQYPPPSQLHCRQLANAFRAIGHLTESSILITNALKKSPQQAELRSDQASLLLDASKSEQAIALFNELARESLREGHIEQGLSFLSNALMCMAYADSIPQQHKKSAAIAWGDWVLRNAQSIATQQQIPAWTAMPGHNRPLRVGFVSGDFCDHPVGFLLLPVLQYRPKNRWQPFIYDNGSRLDNTHRQLRSAVSADDWRLIYNLDDINVTKMILADQLDVLIDLSGHTGRSRLRIMAHRLAGSQLTWLGYSGTSGLSTVDGIILDETLSQGANDQFTETIYKFRPSRFCFRPPFSPPVQSPPCIKLGHVTFGSFNNTAKYNPTLLAVWANILKQVPQSRLILKWRTFADNQFREEIHKTFIDHGIESSRVELRGFSTHRAMLDEYNDVDIALDTFPFNGGFTSLEALWMGLPLITLSGTSPIERQSASFLHTLGFPSWITESTDGYIEAAAATALNIKDLINYRENLRFQIMGSALYDAPTFAMQFSLILDQITAKH